MHHYSKLVRDRLPEEIEKKGGKITYHTAGSDEEFWRKLKEKLQEEVDEFSKDESMENLGDVFDILDAICELKKFDRKNIDAYRENKGIEKGKFQKRIILEISSEAVGPSQEQLI